MPLELLQSLTGHTDRVWTLAWNPTGTILASSGSDKTIRLWAEENEKWICISILTETHNKSIRRVCWSPCGLYLASASFDSTVCIWKRNSTDGSWSTIVNLEGHESEVKSVAWSHDGLYLASCGRDRSVWIWERASSDEDEDGGEEDVAENWDCSDVKNDHTKDVKHIIWHPHHNILVSCSYDDSIKFFHKDGDDWKCYTTLSGHTSTVWSADFSKSGEFLVTCGDDRTVRIWKNHSHSKLPNVEPNSWKCVSVIQGYHKRPIYDVSWSKIEDVIVSASGDNSLALYACNENSSANNELFICIDKICQSHACDVNSVAWNNIKPGLLASGSDDCSIKMWKYENDEKGMRPRTIIHELLQSLHDPNELSAQLSEKSNNDIVKYVTDFSNLLTLTQSLQCLQNELNHDTEKYKLAGLFNLEMKDPNLQPIQITGLRFNEDGSTNSFTIEIIDNLGDIKYRFVINFDKSDMKLFLPRRSSSLLTKANEIFLHEKTGDLYKISNDGSSKFLLGHLFMFSDVKFVTRNSESEISYIISADRDEKIRISNYPNAYKIERYCFGHRHFIRRLIVIDEEQFISIDQQDIACLWNLKHIDKSSSQEPLSPKMMLALNGNSIKRNCLRKTPPKLDNLNSGEATLAI